MTDVIGTRSTQSTAAEKSLRESVEALLKAGQRDSAMQAARLLLNEVTGMRTWRFLRRAAESEAAAQVGFKTFKVALLSSFSIEFLHDALIAYGFANGLKLELYQCAFGAFRQDLLDQKSALYAWSPDVVVLAVRGEDWVPAAYGHHTDEGPADAAHLIESFRQEISALIAALRGNSSASLLINNFAAPTWRHLGILDANTADGQSRLVNRLNEALLEVAASATGVHIVDYAALTHRHGLLHWHDERMRLYAQAPIAQPMLAELAREYLKFFRCLVGLSKKCIVLDLDNTLWGGVVGEEGVDGIHLGANYPGSAFVEFQQHLLALHGRGVVLAIASKNNRADVDEVFAVHRSMLLRKEHFADMQVHWEPKSESLCRIASNLDIGLEHLVLIDDSPAECEQVRRALPMVTIIQLPRQPERYVEALHQDGWFDVLALSQEDLRRGELYLQRASAAALRASGGGVEDYYRALNMELHIAPVDRKSLKRAAQLTQKTNQLNVTTRRYSESQLDALIADPDWSLVTVGVTDRFGDNGIVGIMFARASGTVLLLDTFLLSCRVIGRAVETAMLAHLCDIAEQRGLTELAGELIPTAKNMPVRDLFERHGFAKVNEDASGASLWRIRLPEQRVQYPDWFRLVGTSVRAETASDQA
jgi:FkbH-like protein